MKMLKTLRTLSLSLISALALMGAAQANDSELELKPFSAVYSVKKSGLSLGNAYFSLKNLGDNHWEYASYIKPSGLATLISNDRVKESSMVEVVGNTIRPVYYTYEHTGDKPESASITFNWFKRIAQVNYNGQASSHALSGKEQDHYSLVLNLMRMASSGLASQNMTVINNEVKQYTYTSQGSETVKTPLQKFNATKIVQSGTGSRSLHYWLSPEVNFVPVKIEQHKRGKKNLEMTLKSFTLK